MEGNYNNFNGNQNLGNDMDSTQSSHMENEIKNTGENNFAGSTENVGPDTMPGSVNNVSAGMDNMAAGSAGNTGTDATEVSSTGAQGSLYSYSYVNQENQERNPNYYEKREEDNISAQRVYRAGTYENAHGSNGMGSQENAHGSNAMGGWENTTGSNGATGWRTSGSNAMGGWENPTGSNDAAGWRASASNDAEQNRAWNNSQGYSAEHAGQGTFQGQAATSKKFHKKEKKQKTPGTRKQHGFGLTVAKCASLALVFGLVSSTVFYGTGFAFRKTLGTDKVTQEATAETTGKSAEKAGNGSLSATNVSTATTVTDVSDIVENVMPSIVSITNMGQQEMDFFGRTYTQDTSSAGSGIIMGQTEDEIYIATNNHVVANSTQLMVNFIDDQQVQAEIKGTDASTDLAVLSVKVKDIPSDTMEKIKVATVGSSDDIKVGQSVVAIGNALGYGQAVTTGVISAVDREVTIQDEMTGAAITNNLLQTDAAINPGNSGGALLNMNGEVIGINSVKYADTQVEGMGYAIPISAAEPIINNMISREIVDESKSAYLGVTGQDMTSELAESFGIPEGLYITMVKENSAAEQAGIHKGDVLTKFDGRKISSVEGLADVMQYYEAGSQVEVTLQKNENGEWREETITVTLGKKNE